MCGPIGLLTPARRATRPTTRPRLAVERWRQRHRAVEGCHGAGRFLAQRLVSNGEVVLDVPAKLAARVRVFSQGHGRKSHGTAGFSERQNAWSSRGATYSSREEPTMPRLQHHSELVHVAFDSSKNTLVAGVLRPGEETPTIDRVANDEPSVRRFVKGFPILGCCVLATKQARAARSCTGC